MAGDWIKMRVDLGDDPSVIQMASQLDASEDEVVGKLHRLWSWADRHTTDGTAPAITARWVDRYVGCPGFADAMIKAAWISFSEDGVVFPSFDRHNGESAKKRSEATIRQRLSRENRDNGVTGVARTAIPKPFVRHVMERDAYACVYCGEASTAEKEASRKAILSVDHIKPIARGGSAAVENLACACRRCNSEKSDRTPEEWDLLPTFLQPNVIYQDGQLVTRKSQDSRDKHATRGEKRREEKIEIPSVTDVTGGKPPLTPDEIIFGYGLPILTNAGTPEKQARSFLGGLRKAHGDDALVNTLRECIRAKPLQPLEWLAKAMPPDSTGTASKRETFAERDAKNARKRWEEMTGQQHPDSLPKNITNVIDSQILELSHDQSH